MVSFDMFVIKLIATTIFILLNSGIVWLTAKFFGLEDNDFQTSLLISIVVGLTLLVFCSIPFIEWLTAALIQVVTIALFKRFYMYGWKKTIILWLIWLILFIVLSIMIATVFVIF